MPVPCRRDRAVAVAVLANPCRRGAAGTAAASRRCSSGCAAAGRPVRLLTRRHRGRRETACRQAVADGAGALVAVGGDGTVHLALQAVAGTGVAVRGGAGRHRQRLRRRASACRPTRRRRRGASPPRCAPGARRTVDLARMAGADGDGPLVRGGARRPASTRSSTSGPTGCGWPRGPRRYDLAIVVELAPAAAPRATRSSSTASSTSFDAVLVAVGNSASYGGGHADLPGRRPDRRAARRRRGRAARPGHAGPAQAAGYARHPRRPSRGHARYRARQVEIARRGHHRVRRRRARPARCR